MIVKKQKSYRSKAEEIRAWIGDPDPLDRSGRKKIRSLKRARKAERRWRRGIPERHKEVLNAIYRDLVPGSMVNACLHGNMRVWRVEVDLYPDGYIDEVRVSAPPGSKYAACEFMGVGGCVTTGWDFHIWGKDGEILEYYHQSPGGPPPPDRFLEETWLEASRRLYPDFRKDEA